MPRYRIMIGDYPQHSITAADEDEAIEMWREWQGYDTLAQAAAEYGLEAEHINAVQISD